MFDIQKLAYFVEGNSFTGSKTGKDGEVLRYRVTPDKENAQLKAWCWTEDKCFELAGGKREAAFPLDAGGMDALLGWLGECWPGGRPE